MLPHLAQKYVRPVTEEKAQQAVAALTEDLGFVARTQLFTTILYSSSRGPNGLFQPRQVPGLHVVHIYKCGQNTHKIYLKFFINVLDPPRCLQ